MPGRVVHRSAAEPHTCDGSATALLNVVDGVPGVADSEVDHEDQDGRGQKPVEVVSSQPISSHKSIILSAEGFPYKSAGDAAQKADCRPDDRKDPWWRRPCSEFSDACSLGLRSDQDLSYMKAV